MQPDVYCRRLGLQVPVAVSVKTGQIADVFHAICSVAMHPYVKESQVACRPDPSADVPRAGVGIPRSREALTEACCPRRVYALSSCYRRLWEVFPLRRWWRVEHLLDQGHLQGSG